MRDFLTLFAADADQWEADGVSLAEEDELVLALWRRFRGRPDADSLPRNVKPLYSMIAKLKDAQEHIYEKRSKAGKKGNKVRWHGDDFASRKDDRKSSPTATASVPVTATATASVTASSADLSRSVPVRAGARTREGDPERNGNGTGDLTQEGFALAKRMAKAFADAVKEDEGAFFAPEYAPVDICTALTGDYGSMRRWSQLVREKGEAAVRDEAFRFWRELRAGETVDNRGAALNTRLAKLEDAK